MVNMILCSMYNYVTMYRFTVTGCRRKTAACHVTDPSMGYCIHCFIILTAPTVTMPLTNKVSSSSSKDMD